MDITSAIIGLISLALFIVPILYIQGKQKKGTKKLLDDYARLAEKHRLTISKSDSWNNCFVIGLDKAQSKLLYLKKQKEKEHVVLINLPDVETCTVTNLHRDVNNNRVIDFIGLRFKLRGPKQAEQALEFYNKDESMYLSDELLLCEKWSAIVNANLQAAYQQPAPLSV